ncbi:unnamed protein product [Urochloa decumbens]|uniref:Phospholipid/glycerol acyltransferase domain-containing protein n=1 Tax=Urochloa decumbens TaxID=240449 RepID=A0ABC9B925_9POAL
MADSHRCSSVAAELEGTLLISGSLFPYFLLVALEAGGPLRAATLLALYPLAVLLGAAAAAADLPLLAMTFLSTAGLPASDVSAVARATLPKFFLSDLRASAFRSMATAGESERLVVVTRLPRLLAEPFVKEYLGPDVLVAGSELRLLAGRFTGTLASPSPASFLQVCKQRRLVVSPSPASAALPRSEYRRPLVFHDGRLVFRPEPLACLAALLWVPLGVVLSVTRLLLGFLPHGAGLLLAAATGFRIRAAGLPSSASRSTAARRGTLFACNHQTLMDPVILSTVLRRPVTAVTYSLSGFSEAIAPIRTVRLTRDRRTDAEIMRRELVARGGDLVVCPEGTTCREPYLLRFSPLFAEVAGDQQAVTPTAVRAGGALFHGSTVRGYKWLDSVFFLMNPAPWYEIRILKPVATAVGGGGGGAAASREVANGVQRVIGDELGFECTGLTRKDKYRMIAGHDGVDARSAPAAAS